MKALIFAAGLGSRLKPITDTIPKALVPVGGKPLLEHIVLKLKNSGFDEIIINVHHFAGQIIDFLKLNNHFGIRIEISDERDLLLDTGGGIKQAASFFDDGKPFLVHNVDILSNPDLADMYRSALENKAMATLLVSERPSSRHLLFDEQENLCGWLNEQTGETKSPYSDFHSENYRKLAFGGIHVISPAIFPLMDKWNGKFSIIDFYLSVCNTTAIRAYTTENLQLIDVGKQDTLKKAEEFLQIYEK
ncbi:MAG: nucleotidyltransferase family protein [Candidatus Symbiothrix sp.]|jgi:NDP-sugar pyrophosphorylase family protein|nr:nucleotidyltransferase family protein [Candidatus Symbiothrix sp.]